MSAESKEAAIQAAQAVCGVKVAVTTDEHLTARVPAQPLPPASPPRPNANVSMPVAPQLPNLATPQQTNDGIRGWLRNNYSGAFSGVGANRQNFYRQIQSHIKPQAPKPNMFGRLLGRKPSPAPPDMIPQYTEFLNNKYTDLTKRVGVPYEESTAPAGGPASGGLLSSSVHIKPNGQRVLTLPNSEYAGQNYFVPHDPKDGPPSDLYDWGRAMPRSLVGLHERQHLLQDLPSAAAQAAAGFKPIDHISSLGITPNSAFMEPAAVLTEMAHAADAAKQVTGKPVPGDTQLAPHYFMPIDELRHEAERAGVLSGKTTAQEKLNTPAGQAWLRMQLQQHADEAGLEKQNKAEMGNDLATRFTPDYTPEQLENLGVYDALYRGQGPRLASLGEWKPEWVNPVDPKGWAQWYKRYSGGRRLGEEDERQIKRWLSFKARHGGPFSKNPTPRRGWALRNWGIDPSKLVDKEQAQTVTEMLDAYQRKAMQRHVQEQIKQSAELADRNPERQIDSILKQADSAANPAAAKPPATPAVSPAKSFGQRLGNAASGVANRAIQSPLGQTALGGVAHAYNNYMPQTGKNVVKKMVPHYGSPEQISAYGMQGKWQPEPFVNQSFQYGSAISSNNKMQYSVDRANPQSNFNTLSTQMQSHEPVKVTGSPLQQLGHGLSYGVMPSQTFQPNSVASLHTNLSNSYDSRNENGIQRTLTQNLTSLPAGMFPELEKQNNAQKQAELLPEIQLQDHQQRIADRVSGEDPRMLVYHGLGSGKSLSALAAAEAAKQKYQEDYGIVVPASLRGNFQKEVKKFTKGSDPEIMSYTGLALGKHFKDQPDTVIMDEAHRLRNPEAASSQAARRVADHAKRVMLLTGSPITNSPTDLAGLLSMLTDKTITPEEFQKRYVGYQSVSPGWINWLRGIKPGEKPYVKNEDELRQMLRGKVDYQPSKTPEGVNVNEEVIRVPLSSEQQKIQKAIRTKIPPGFLWKLDREFPLSRDELSRLNSFLTGLRQVGLSTQPFRVDKDPAKAFTQSSKLQTAMKNLQQVLDSDPRKKAIIYSNFIDSGLKPYSAALEKAQIPHGIFHGSVPVKQRLQALKDYNEGKLRALLLGPAAAEGISTKGTSLIQLLDPHWHESRSQQAKGRGLRFDSHADLPDELKNVAVQRYISSSQDPSWLGKWLGYQRERTGDEVLEHLTADKERLNEEFRKILRDVGTKK